MSQSNPSWWSEPPPILAYTVAAAAVGIALVAAIMLDTFLNTAPFVSTFLCALMFVAWFGGIGPGLLATALAIGVFAYFFVPPLRSFALDFSEVPRIALFSIAAVFVVSLTAAQRRTTESLRLTRDHLQTAVQEQEKLNRMLQGENAERKLAEQQLRQAERELQMTIDTIPLGVARFGPDGAAQFFNQAWRNYVGLSLEALKAQRWDATTHPHDRLIAEREWFAHLPTGEPFETEQRERRADGEYRWHLIRRVALRDETGNVIRWYAAGYDIEDRKRAESALRRSEAYLAEAQRLSHTGSFGWKVATGDIVWSEEAYRILGIDRAVKPTIGLVLDHVHPEDRDLVQREFNRVAQGEQDFDYEHRFLTPSGLIKHLHVRAHRVTYESGEAEIIGALMDVTATRAAQEALHAAQAELAHVTRVTTLGEMSASIAHEVNQPLAAIVTNGDAGLRWLSGETPNLDETRAAVTRIIGEAHRAGGVIRRIRDLAKKAAPEMIALDINDVVDDAVALVRREAHNHRVALRLQRTPDLHPVRGDRIQVQQVIINLAINAVQAMATVIDRPRELVIRTAPHEGGEVLVAVQDTGVGIAPENLSRLFSAFYTTKPDGMGMGLSICRSIVEAHGGRIWASPNRGPGMTFQFTLAADRQGG